MKVELDDVLKVLEAFEDKEYFLLYNPKEEPLPVAKVNKNVWESLVKAVKAVDKTKYYKCINCGKDIYFDRYDKGGGIYIHMTGSRYCEYSTNVAIPYPTGL